jgi:excisionase family DNA binding protein
MDSIDENDTLGYDLHQVNAMKCPEDVARELESVRVELEQSGQTALAQKVDRSIADLRERVTVSMPEKGVMTTGEAAKKLGIRSVNTVKRWVNDGLLIGLRLGSRVMVTRESVDRLLESAVPERQRVWEQGLAEALAPFDAGDEELPPSAATTLGRKPWEADDKQSSAETTKNHV